MKKGKKYFPLKHRDTSSLFLRFFERHAFAHHWVIFLERHLDVGELLLVLGGPNNVPRSRGFHLDEIVLRHAEYYTP